MPSGPCRARCAWRQLLAPVSRVYRRGSGAAHDGRRRSCAQARLGPGGPRAPRPPVGFVRVTCSYQPEPSGHVEPTRRVDLRGGTREFAPCGVLDVPHRTVLRRREQRAPRAEVVRELAERRQEPLGRGHRPAPTHDGLAQPRWLVRLLHAVVQSCGRAHPQVLDLFEFREAGLRGAVARPAAGHDLVWWPAGVVNSRRKKRSAAAVSRCSCARTSSTRPCSSTARQK